MALAQRPWRSRRPWAALVWLGVAAYAAAYAAAGAVPSEATHGPLAAMLVLLAAFWTNRRMQRDQHRRAHHMAQTIIALRRHAAAFERDATTDALTGLANRKAFDRELALAFEERLSGNASALLLIDLDGFKQINDTWGHGIGDAALRQVARVLLQESRAEDLVARLGGDEFGVLARSIDGAAARRLAQRLQRAAASKSVHQDADGKAVRVSFSVGIAALADHADLDAALISADRDLYAEKARAIANDPALADAKVRSLIRRKAARRAA